LLHQTGESSLLSQAPQSQRGELFWFGLGARNGGAHKVEYRLRAKCHVIRYWKSCFLCLWRLCPGEEASKKRPKTGRKARNRPPIQFGPSGTPGVETVAGAESGALERVEDSQRASLFRTPMEPRGSHTRALDSNLRSSINDSFARSRRRTGEAEERRQLGRIWSGRNGPIWLLWQARPLLTWGPHRDELGETVAGD